MYRNRKHPTLKKTLKKKRQEKVKRIYIEYTDSIFPNNDLLKFKNVENIMISGNQRLRKKETDSLLKPTKIRIDINKLNQLTNLQYLQFEWLDFNNFPKEICFIKQLKGLSFNFCFIDSIPKEISNLKFLEVLELKLNNIKHLPKEIKNLDNLLILGLANNLFTELPEEILGIKKIQKINLSNLEGREEFKEVGFFWPYPVHISKIDYSSQSKLFINILKMPHLQKICISVKDKNEKMQIESVVFDKSLLKKICWEPSTTPTPDR